MRELWKYTEACGKKNRAEHIFLFAMLANQRSLTDERRKRMKRYKCDCHNHEKQVCDICQGVTPTDSDSEKARVAEEIAGQLWRDLYENGQITTHELEIVEKALESYAEERVSIAVRKAMVSWTQSTDWTPLIDLSREKGYLEGFRAGQDATRERAATIADGCCFCENHCKSESDYHDVECNACDVAKSIRDMAEELK